jgi:hypothetical protein
LPHGSNEAIAATGQRLDAAPTLSGLIENVPEVRNLNVEIGFLDHSARPDRLHERIFRDELTTPLDQYTEQFDGAPA